MNTYLERLVVDGLDRDLWLDARIGKIGGSDAAGFAKVESANLYLRAKLYNPFDGNAYTAHGNDRERSMLAAFGIPQNRALFRSIDNPRHVCTPDGLIVHPDGELAGHLAAIAQAKTVVRKYKKRGTEYVLDADEQRIPLEPFTNAKGERAIPPQYLRQMAWEQYVMDTFRTLFVFEEHEGFRPVDMEPRSVIVERDEIAHLIPDLVEIADIVLAGMDAAERFKKEIDNR